MSSCLEYSVKTLRYLDNDLKGQELEDFLAHVNTCADCRARPDSEQALSQITETISSLVFGPRCALRPRLRRMELLRSLHERVVNAHSARSRRSRRADR